MSDYTRHMFVQCASRLDEDPQFRAAVTAYNKSELYAWFQSALVHVWLCLGRMYSPPIEARELMSQEMSEHFFAEVERKLVHFGTRLWLRVRVCDISCPSLTRTAPSISGVTNPLAFNREYKRLAGIFHGTCVAYEKAYMAKDDDMFGRAVWRNLLNQDPDTYEPGGPRWVVVCVSVCAGSCEWQYVHLC